MTHPTTPTWRPISEAPRDGTVIEAPRDGTVILAWDGAVILAWDGAVILAWDGDIEFQIIVRFHDAKGWVVDWDGEPNPDITYWQPLPPPPETAP